MFESKVLSFGTVAMWAVKGNYSVSYFKRAFAKNLPVLGRFSYTQGKPALRCEDAFLQGCKEIAKGLPRGAKAFFVTQDGLQSDGVTDSDFLQFAVRDASIFVHACQIGGRIFFIEDATVMKLGVA